MSIDVSIDLSDLKRALADGQRALERGASDAVFDMAELAAEEARQNHPYQDRTGDLTASIDASRGYDGPLAARVSANTPYASYVEAGTGRSAPHPYLGPAVALHTSQSACDFAFGQVAQAVQAAINKP